MQTSKLIKEAKHGSSAAQRYLFDQFSEKMLMICRRYVKSNEDSEELMLNGFYKFYKKLSAFEYLGDAALYMWLKKVMINECLMFLRRKHIFDMVTEADVEDVALEEDALNNLSAAEIFKMIVQLPVGYRTVFNLYVIEGMPHKEVASLLNISEGTSKSQLSKAKVLLQKMLLQNDMDYDKRKTN